MIALEMLTEKHELIQRLYVMFVIENEKWLDDIFENIKNNLLLFINYGKNKNNKVI
ncbi:hypothetical protein J6T66_01285 [bacterium]|nr:hypothetical protein [bacterium]